MRIDRKRLSEIVNAQSEILRMREVVTEQETLKRYEQAATRIEAETNRAIRQVEQLKASGEPLQSAMFRLNRYQSLQQQIDSEIQKVTGTVLRQVQTNQAFAAGLAQQTAFSTTHILLDADSPNRVAVTGIMSDWTRLPKDALDDLIGFMSNGKPLMNMLQNISSATAEHATRILTEGLAIGKNPRVVAREMRQSTSLAANRALTISRTEMLRSYRESTRRAFTANAFETGGVVKGWVWHSALDSRCCSCCISMHGQVFKVEEKQNGHPNCRCAMVPQTATWEELGFTDIPDTNPDIQPGYEWFRKQPESVQKAILGPGKLNLYKQNRITLADTVTTKVNPVWGSVRTEASIAESLQNASVRRMLEQAEADRLKAERLALNTQLQTTQAEKDAASIRRKFKKGDLFYRHKDEMIRDYMKKYESDVAIPQQLHGMPDPVDMFSVRFEGMTYHFPEELREKMVNSLMDVATAERLPETLTKHTDHTYLTTTRNKNDSIFEARYNMPGFVSHATGGGGTKSIVYYNGVGIDIPTQAHEMAHNLADALWGTTKPPDDSAFGLVANKLNKFKTGLWEQPVREYGTVGIHEDFATAFEMYFQNNDVMKLTHPLRYKVIKKMLRLGY